MKEALNQRTNRLQQLKNRALTLIEQQSHVDPAVPMINVEVTQLVEDLRIYQVELELQNEELRRAQQEAELSKVRFQALFEQLPMPSMVIDSNGMLQRCNDRCSRLLGPRKNHALHDNRLFRALSRKDRVRVQEALRSVALGDPIVLHKIEPVTDEPAKLVFDAHLIRLSNTWHLDGHAMLLLVDRSAEAALEQDRHLFSLLLDSSDALIYATDTHGKMLVANNALLDSLGRSRDEVLGQHRELFLPLRDALMHRSTDEAVLRTGETLTLEEQIHANGQNSALDFFTRKFPLHDLQGNTYGVAGISTDITEMKMQQRQALLSESVFLAASEAILITDQDNRIVRVNPAFTAMSGFSESSVVGHRPSILKSGRQDACFFNAMWEALHTTGKWAGEMSNRAADGTTFTVWSSINVIHDEHGKIMHYMAIQTDVTRLREAQIKVEQLASYDSLTGLPNRTLFNDRISHLIAHVQRYNKTFAVLFVDLDHFKEINDSLGHQVGDDLLKMIAKRLLDGVRSEDTVARMGGDEFVVILPTADHATVQRVADKLLENLRAPMPLGPLLAYQPQASIGIAVYPFDGTSTDMLLRNADIAMYAAKLAGRNRSTVYDAKMSEDNARVFAIQTELSAGIERQELRLFFQPKFRLDSGELEGAEALVRWQRPGHGLLSPAEFIPIAEKSGLVVAIDHWVLKESLRQIGRWQDNGLWKKSWRVAVNHSASDLRRPEMVANLKSMFHEFCIGASMLELEITEGALLENTKETIQRLAELKEMGVSLAIDDFGTGYSSLAYLRKLPISVIKIDRSFIHEMLVNENGRVLVETIIAMAHKLGHRLVAEGVEEEAQRECLASLGCEVAQGYLFGRPVDAEAFEAAYLSSVTVA